MPTQQWRIQWNSSRRGQGRREKSSMLTKMRMRLWILRRSAVLTCGDACPVSLREASTTSTTPRACMGMYFVSCVPYVPCRCEISAKMPDTGLRVPALAPLSQAGLAALMAHSLSGRSPLVTPRGNVCRQSYHVPHISWSPELII